MNVLENPKSFKQMRGFYCDPVKAKWMPAQIYESIESIPNFQTKSQNNKSNLYMSTESVGGDTTALVAGPIPIIGIKVELGRRNQAF